MDKSTYRCTTRYSQASATGNAFSRSALRSARASCYGRNKGWRWSKHGSEQSISLVSKHSLSAAGMAVPGIRHRGAGRYNPSSLLQARPASPGRPQVNLYQREIWPTASQAKVFAEYKSANDTASRARWRYFTPASRILNQFKEHPRIPLRRGLLRMVSADQCWITEGRSPQEYKADRASGLRRTRFVSGASLERAFVSRAACARKQRHVEIPRRNSVGHTASRWKRAR